MRTHKWWILLLVLVSVWLAAMTVGFYVFLTVALRDEMSELRVRVRGPLAGDDPRVVALVRDTFLDPPSTLPYNLSTSFLTNNVKYNESQHFIRRHVAKLFAGQNGGFFIEAGALDGEAASNTLFLELPYGWTGLLVEPQPENYVELLRKHRRAWSSNTCLSLEPYPKEMVLVTQSKRKYPGGLLGHSYKASSHLYGVQLDTHVYDSFFQLMEKSYSATQCFPLVSYLLALNVSTIDFLSLDIQGAEKSVLRHFPWQSYTIRVMAVEIVHHETFDQEFVDVMKERGYVLLASESIDYIFVKEGDTVLQNQQI